MVQITPIDGQYYITVSTDQTGSQDHATIVRADSLSDISEGKYEDIYSKYFVGGGTPYYITQVEDTDFASSGGDIINDLTGFCFPDREFIFVSIEMLDHFNKALDRE